MPDNIKKILIFFSKMFFEKLNYFFSKKAKLVTLCHHLGKARVEEKSNRSTAWELLN